ncbi:hypothetical protein B0H13DRAFT_1856091 [Mycena leptocephala]|nr:hypothetical protein B0H13DRAFT_1856091 [Mycena leptocephala]
MVYDNVHNFFMEAHRICQEAQFILDSLLNAEQPAVERIAHQLTLGGVPGKPSTTTIFWNGCGEERVTDLHPTRAFTLASPKYGLFRVMRGSNAWTLVPFGTRIIGSSATWPVAFSSCIRFWWHSIRTLDYWVDHNLASCVDSCIRFSVESFGLWGDCMVIGLRGGNPPVLPWSFVIRWVCEMSGSAGRGQPHKRDGHSILWFKFLFHRVKCPRIARIIITAIQVKSLSKISGSAELFLELSVIPATVAGMAVSSGAIHNATTNSSFPAAAQAPASSTSKTKTTAKAKRHKRGTADTAWNLFGREYMAEHRPDSILLRKQKLSMKSLGMSISPVITPGAGLGSWFFIVLILHNQQKYRQSERNSQQISRRDGCYDEEHTGNTRLERSSGWGHRGQGTLTPTTVIAGRGGSWRHFHAL